MRLEIISATAKKEVDSTRNIGLKKRLSRSLCGIELAITSRRELQLAVAETRRFGVRPRFVQLVLPIELKRCRIFRTQEHRDLCGSAGHTPVHVNFLAPILFPELGEGRAKLIADFFIVRRDDDQPSIILGRCDAFLRLQQKRSRERQQQGENERCFLAPMLN